MGAIGESGFLSGKYGTEIGISDLRNAHALVGYQYDILSTGRGPARDERQQQD